MYNKKKQAGHVGFDFVTINNFKKQAGNVGFDFVTIINKKNKLEMWDLILLLYLCTWCLFVRALSIKGLNIK